MFCCIIIVQSSHGTAYFHRLGRTLGAAAAPACCETGKNVSDTVSYAAATQKGRKKNMEVPHNILMGTSMPMFILLPVQCLRTADDLDNLVGDGSLACFIVAEAQFFEKLGGIVRSLLHGVHARPVLAG